MSTTKLKDPNAVKDYLFNFGRELGPAGDAITSIASVTVSPSGLTIGSGSPLSPTIAAGTDASGTTVAASAVRVWLSGGTAGVRYSVTCRVVTSGGRTHDLTGDVFCIEL